MIFIETNYVPHAIPVTMEDCRVYGETDCNNHYFDALIYENRDVLQDEFIEGNKLFVLMDNKNLQKSPDYYASITFKAYQRGEDTIYQTCLITKERCVSIIILKEFISRVFKKLSWEGHLRIAFTSNPLETTYRIDDGGNRERCINNLIEELGINNEQNEQPN